MTLYTRLGNIMNSSLLNKFQQNHGHVPPWYYQENPQKIHLLTAAIPSWRSFWYIVQGVMLLIVYYRFKQLKPIIIKVCISFHTSHFGLEDVYFKACVHEKEFHMFIIIIEDCKYCKRKEPFKNKGRRSSTSLPVTSRSNIPILYTSVVTAAKWVSTTAWETWN